MLLQACKALSPAGCLGPRGSAGDRGDRQEKGLCERARTWQRHRLCGTSSACSVATPHAMGGQPAAIIPPSPRHSPPAAPPRHAPPAPSPLARQLSAERGLSAPILLLSRSQNRRLEKETLRDSGTTRNQASCLVFKRHISTNA